jgi:hypothetical protein
LELVESKKTQNVLGEIYTAWNIAVLRKHYADPEWERIIISAPYDKAKLEDLFKCINIDVISKLVASPRLNLLNKAWGMFYGTGDITYLRIAYETAGNSRSSNSVRAIAVKMYQEAQEFYNENYASPSACARSFAKMEGKIMKRQGWLQTLKEEGTLKKYMDETEQKFPEKVDELVKKIKGIEHSDRVDDSDADPDEKEKKAKIRNAEKRFNEIAKTVFDKIV